MYICKERILELIKSLNSMQDAIVLTSDKKLEDRMHAISEVKYYNKILENFHGLTLLDQKEIILQLCVLVEEIDKWLKEEAK